MAESQSRYAIIEELTNKLNEERGNIATIKETLELNKAKTDQALDRFNEFVKNDTRLFNQKWEDEKETALKIEERYKKSKKQFERDLENARYDFDSKQKVAERNLKALETNSEEKIRASEYKIKEIKSSINSLKEVSKESSKTISSNTTTK